MPNNFRTISGLILIIFGIGLLIDQLGLNSFLGFGLSEILSLFWPFVFLFIGIHLLKRKHFVAAMIAIFFSATLIISTLFNFNILTLWPLILIFLGIRALSDNKTSIGRSTTNEITDDQVFTSVVFGSKKLSIVDQSTKGGQVSCTFGEVVLDYSEAGISNANADLEVSCVFGNVEIQVPQNAVVKSTGSAFLGNWENHVNAPGNPDPDSPTFTIRGLVVFGNVEIHH